MTCLRTARPRLFPRAHIVYRVRPVGVELSALSLEMAPGVGLFASPFCLQDLIRALLEWGCGRTQTIVYRRGKQHSSHPAGSQECRVVRCRCMVHPSLGSASCSVVLVVGRFWLDLVHSWAVID